MLKDSVLSYPDRGPYGDNKFRGNTSGNMIKDLILEYRLEGYAIKKVLDPMEGSGTTGDVCKELDIEYIGLDLSSGFDLLSDTIPNTPYDFIFFHPPYWGIIKYSDDPRDLSNIQKYPKYIRALKFCLNKCWLALGKNGLLVLQIGDVRKRGKYYFITGEISVNKDNLKAVLIKRQHNIKSSGWYYGSKFIPIKHEYLIVWQR